MVMTNSLISLVYEPPIVKDLRVVVWFRLALPADRSVPGRQCIGLAPGA